MASELATPLLPENDVAGVDLSDGQLKDVYLRFSSTRKNIILAIVSGCEVINCMVTTSSLAFHLLPMSRFFDWDIYTFNTTDCQGPEFNGGGRQVIHFP